MKQNENAPGADVQTPRVGNEGVSCNDYTIAQDFRQVRVSDFLRRGSGNPTPRRDLIVFTGWGAREITRAIEAERRSGTPIAASANGYYLPANEFELDDYLNRLQHREREIRRTRAAIAATRQQTMAFEGSGDDG